MKNNNVTVGSPWMSYRQAAAYLGVSVGSLRNWVASGRISAARNGGVVRFHRETLDAWLQRGNGDMPMGTDKR